MVLQIHLAAYALYFVSLNWCWTVLLLLEYFNHALSSTSTCSHTILILNINATQRIVVIGETFIIIKKEGIGCDDSGWN